MSDVIRVLEDLGCKPGVSVSGADDYAAAIAASGLDMSQRHAFLKRDAGALNDLLGVRDTVRCLIATPD
jgi:hypothetical protein